MKYPAKSRCASYLTILALIASSTAVAGGLGDILRNVTGALNSVNTPQPQKPTPTATLGIRGIDETQTNNQKADYGGYAMMEKWASNKAEATRIAASKKLKARTVPAVP